MADIDLATIAGADLTAFREAMAKVGVPVLLGKALAVDVAADTTDVALPIEASAPYMITAVWWRIASGAFMNSSARLYDEPAGAGEQISNPDALSNSSVGDWSRDTSVSSGLKNPLTAESLYIYNGFPNDTALSLDVYVFGHYVPA